MKQALWIVVGVLLAASLACSTKFKEDEDGDGDGGDVQDTDADDGDGRDTEADAPAETDGPCGPGSCTIGGECFGGGENRPEYPCQICDPAVDDGDWTPLPEGTPCADATFCNGEEQCTDTGDCVGSVSPCPVNADCVEEEPHCRCRPGWHGDGCTLCHRYVAPGGTGPDGRSWERAFGEVQAAIDAALEDGCDEVWAREGEYLPASTIQMKGAVALYGGFAGDEPARDMRDWRAHETILNGGGAVGPVVRFDGTSCSDGARLDGFTLAGGNNTSGPGSGGAVYVNQVSPTIAACTFMDNAAGSGGALYLNRSDARVLDCKFTGNAAGNGGAVAMYGDVDDPVTPYFENCLFWNNDANNFGGAVYLDRYSRPALMTCTIVDNRANTGDNTSPLGKWGGGICIYEADISAVSVVNSIVFSNVHLDPVSDTFVPSQVQCLFVTTPPCEPVITAVHADIEGGCPGCSDGGGNISGNPQFLDPGADNYHPNAGSPCIDKGLDTDAPALDLDGIARHDTPSVGDVGVVTDIGCYELP
jgi:hypothetical protein